MDNTRRHLVLWLVVILLLALVCYGFYYIRHQKQNWSTQATTLLALPVTESDWSKGEGPITLVVYADFQCPTSARVAQTIRDYLSQNQPRLQVVFRHFPVTSPQAELAASAAEAAGLQGKFWQMHDQLYTYQSQWSQQETLLNTFISYAQELGLEVTKFNQDLNSELVKKAVQEDQQSALKSGVVGTPTLFLNNQNIPIPSNVKQLAKLVDQESKNMTSDNSSNNQAESSGSIELIEPQGSQDDR